MVTFRQIDQLLNYQRSDFPVVSFYLNTDLRHLTPEQLKTTTKDLIKLRREEIESSDLGHAQKEALKTDLERISHLVETLTVEGHQRGLVVFSARGGEFWQVFKLPQKVKNALIIDPDPYVRPLLAILNQYHRFCFAIVDRKKAQIFEYYLGELQDISELMSADVPGKVRLAGWYGLEEKRVMRHIDYHAHLHFKRVAQLLFNLHSARHFDYFVLGGQSEYLPEFEQHLHSYILDRVVKRVDTTPHAWEVNKIKQFLQETEEELNRQKSQELILQLVTDAAKNNRAVLGLEKTLQAANSGAIRLLLIEEDTGLPGRECFSCGFLSVTEEVCPVCGSKTEPMEDLFDEIVENTVNFNGDFYQVPAGSELNKYQGIGAFLRFDV